MVRRLAVGKHLNSIGRKLVADLVRQLPRVNKERRVGLAHETVRDYDRVVRNIAAADVEQPGDVIERAYQVPVRTSFLHLGADLRELLASAQSGEAHIVDRDRMGGQRRAIRMNESNKIVACHEFDR